MMIRDKIHFRILTFIVICTFYFASVKCQITSGLINFNAQSTDGYILFSPISSRNTYLMDRCGFIVRQWQSQFFPGQNVHLLPDGNLLRACRIGGAFTTGGIGGRVELTTWENELVWSHDFANDTIHQHHVVHPMPNGNLLVLLYHLKTKEEAEQSGFRPELVPDRGIWSEKIIEIKIIDNNMYELIWEWNMWDHLIQDFDPTKENYGNVTLNPEKMDVNFRDDNGPNPSDWLHFNSLDYHPVLDQILIGSRHHSEVYVIDHSTTIEEARTDTGGKYGKGGNFLYRFGNSASYSKSNSSERYFYGQHDAQWAEKTGSDDAIMVYNNGINRPEGLFSEIFIWRPAYDSEGGYIVRDGFFGITEILKQYRAKPQESMFSARLSGVHMLKNGNLLICEGNKGRVTEIDNNENIVWEFINPINNFGVVPQGVVPQSNDLFTVKIYGKDYTAFSGKDLNIPSLPLTPSPATDYCVITTSAGTDWISETTDLVRYNIENSIIYFTKTVPAGTQYLLYNSIGNVIKTGQLLNENQQVELSHLHSGVYFIRLTHLESKLKYSSLIIKI